ncbi:hypothetical protein WN55_08478 [Dufourea novaeangliae]|uniref:Uncharacterized protein n=1 Tax=Dufourea novaeangliae TaxID=178035 RepID=A0A154P585_DUFNO|nr:hypothetical protein WN55_08478 [Dufourea novaeangliae]
MTKGLHQATRTEIEGGSSKFISGHPRAEPSGTNSIASVVLFCEQAPETYNPPPLSVYARRRGFGSIWLARWLDSGSPIHPLPPPCANPPFDWRKSLRLTGSHGITGTRDIYASSPADRGITRNKEIANLLRPTPTSSFPVRGLPPPLVPRPPSSTRSDIVRPRVDGGTDQELFRVLWVETASNRYSGLLNFYKNLSRYLPLEEHVFAEMYTVTNVHLDLVDPLDAFRESRPMAIFQATHNRRLESRFASGNYRGPPAKDRYGLNLDLEHRFEKNTGTGREGRKSTVSAEYLRFEEAAREWQGWGSKARENSTGRIPAPRKEQFPNGFRVVAGQHEHSRRPTPVGQPPSARPPSHFV